MAKFIAKDTEFEGRQFTESSKTSIQKWLGLRIVKSGDFLFEFVDENNAEFEVAEPFKINEWIVKDPTTGVIEIYTEEELNANLRPIKIHDGLVFSAPPAQNNQSVGQQEIENRFGHHKATLEGPNASAPKHSMLRSMFKDFAGRLDQVLPQGRYKSLVMTDLEKSSMWAHKAIAETSKEQ